MRKYTENQPLLTSVEENDQDEIKRILIDNIFFLQGDRIEINKAVEYAINQSEFIFEEHREMAISDKNNKENYFTDEKWNMDENYSRERYNLLVELYHEAFSKQEYTYESSGNSSNDDVLKKFIIGGVVIFAGYLIYKALS